MASRAKRDSVGRRSNCHRGTPRWRRGQRPGDHQQADDDVTLPATLGAVKRAPRWRYRTEHGRHGCVLPGTAGHGRNAVAYRGAHAGADRARHEADARDGHFAACCMRG